MRKHLVLSIFIVVRNRGKASLGLDDLVDYEFVVLPLQLETP